MRERNTENINRVPVKTLKTQRLENDKQIAFFYHWLFCFSLSVSRMKQNKRVLNIYLIQTSNVAHVKDFLMQ